jgi:hypothetical protein
VPIDVRRVGKGLKRVEGDADREDDIRCRRGDMPAEGAHQQNKIVEYECSIFEMPQQPQVGDETNSEEQRLSPSGLRAVNPPGGEPVYDRGDSEESNKGFQAA